MKDLRILSFIGASFTNISIEMNNYDVDDLNFDMTVDTDYIYSGLHKPFKNQYIGIESNDTPGAVKREYYNGTSWVDLAVVDGTVNFTRSGFVTWDLPSDWVATEIDGESLFYIRTTATIDVDIQGINMLFANDNDLREHYRNINEYLGSDTSYIATHQASKKDIIQKIRNSKKVKISSIDNTITDLTIWDFTRPEQLRNAATYLCLSKIFAGVSDNADGKFLQLSRSFRKDYKESVDTFLMNVDINDNGLEDTSEESESQNITRIVYV